MKLLLLLFYIFLTSSFVIYKFSGDDNLISEYLVEKTDAAQSVKDKFFEVGGLQHDFRKKEGHDQVDCSCYFIVTIS